MNQRKTMDMIQKMNGTMAMIRAQTMATIPAPATVMIQAPTTATIPVPVTVMIQEMNGAPRKTMAMTQKITGAPEKITEQVVAMDITQKMTGVQGTTMTMNLKNGPPKRILGATPEMVGIQERKSTTGLPGRMPGTPTSMMATAHRTWTTMTAGYPEMIMTKNLRSIMAEATIKAPTIG